MPDLMNWTVPRLLSTAARLSEHAWNERLAALNLTHAGVIVLEVLNAGGAMSSAQLAKRIRVQGQTMGKTLGRLESHGHVVRERSETDRRSQLVRITEGGLQALEEASCLERLLVSDGDGDSTALNDRLAVIIRSLGDTRFDNGTPGTR
jgi:MarR family transcriptional regulator, organic hydroperoxide resistance regulator